MKTQLFFQTFIIGGLMGIGLSATGAPREVTLRSNGTAADVAVSVIDNKIATAEKESTILTSMLLKGDLRGSVEDAGWYFPDSVTTTHYQAMDGLMLTQGWSRYDIPAALDGKYEEVESELEIGPSISGVVKSRWMGKPMKDVAVLTLAPSLAYAGEALTDEQGVFVFTDQDFPEGTKFIFQALNSKGGNEGNFDITPVKYPSVTPLSSASAAAVATNDPGEDDADFDWRISHSDAIMLGEVMVVQKKPSDYDNPIELMARGEVDYKDIEKQKLTTIEDILRKIPGLVVANRNAYYQTHAVDIWVDNLPWQTPSSNRVGRRSTGGIIANTQMKGGRPSDKMFINNYTVPSSTASVLGQIDQVLPVDFIKKVQFFPPVASQLLSPWATGGIVMITTMDGTEKIERPDWRIRYATPLGYQKRKEFYTPKYELMADYELNNRPTLYWIPRATVDRFGNLSLPIPAAVDSYTLIAEGIDADGHPVRITKSM